MSDDAALYLKGIVSTALTDEEKQERKRAARKAYKAAHPEIVAASKARHKRKKESS